MKNVHQTLIRWGRRFGRDEAGGTMAYVAFFTLIAAGAGTLAIDVGRMTVLRAEMQNRADAGALAGAAQLDGRDGAQARAQMMAVGAVTESSRLAVGNGDLAVESVQFYKSISPMREPATGDDDSWVIEVKMAEQQVDHMFDTMLRFASGGAPNTRLNAQATAAPRPFICHAPPLMVCDPGEADATRDLDDPANAGRQIQLKPPPGGGSWAPGNYGLLALPDGSLGASAIENALAAVEPQDCYSLDVTTAPGVKTNKVQNGVNARFGLSTHPYPAPNVINYPKDPDIEDGSEPVMGSGAWDVAGYWAEKHDTPLPTGLIDASRYQVYLYEIGHEFARNGRQTVYPVDGELGDGFSLVTPPGPSIPSDADNGDDSDYDGEPDGDATVAENGQARRLVQVAILQCNAEGVRGSHEYPTNGQYLEMFITEAVDEEPAGGIYAEIVRPLSTVNDPDFHANVRLVE